MYFLIFFFVVLLAFIRSFNNQSIYRAFTYGVVLQTRLYIAIAYPISNFKISDLKVMFYGGCKNLFFNSFSHALS